MGHTSPTPPTPFGAGGVPEPDHAGPPSLRQPRHGRRLDGDTAPAGGGGPGDPGHAAVAAASSHGRTDGPGPQGAGPGAGSFMSRIMAHVPEDKRGAAAAMLAGRGGVCRAVPTGGLRDG